MGPRSWNAEKTAEDRRESIADSSLQWGRVHGTRKSCLVRSPTHLHTRLQWGRVHGTRKRSKQSTRSADGARFNGAAFMERGKGRSRKLFAGMVCDEQLRVA